MPARTGQQYLDGLRSQERHVWLGGERVKDVTTHPGLRNGARTIAALYDMQHDPALRDEMTYVAPATGEREGLSFIIPRTREELERRRVMMLHWARATCGMMGRTPDFMNVNFAAWAGAAPYFAQARPEFADNVRRYHEHITRHDLTLTHALINLQRSRDTAGTFKLEEGTALRVVRETDAGLVVRGARILATLGPLADEIAVYSPRLGRMAPGASPFAINFAIPCGTPGLQFLCRESFDLERSRFDHPLGSRFEEMDCVVFFDDVVVPWERVFLFGDVDLVNGTGLKTHSNVHTAHQGAAKNLAKCEFVLGVALLMTETLGNAQLPHAEERLGELMLQTELIRACMRASEADATLDEWGVMCPAQLPVESSRNLFMTAYPRMIEILQLLGSSSFMITPSEADFRGPLAPAIEQYLATDAATARDRVKLFRLAWDVAGSAFGSRQVLYERFFASDPLTRARILNALYPKREAADRVRDFLGRD
ncbi:MAG: 4-hydroxyphenylacetate 3-monooxygenase, oxygenase component [Candidatus Rokubacteria bacterium]|nr:4-hydroxyphenylacetate 3-monooxygenase, oxygenase component [Candidatus Rokubacteria bacterium]